MSDKVDEKLIEKIEGLTTTLAESTSKLASTEVENKTLKDSVAALEVSKKEISDKLTASEAKVSALETVIAELKTKIEDVTNKFTEANDKLVKISAEAKKVSRLAVIREKGKTADEAEALFVKFENLDDKTFAEVVSLIEAKVATPASPTVEASELETPVTEPVVVVTTPAINPNEKTIAEVREFFKQSLNKSKNKE